MSKIDDLIKIAQKKITETEKGFEKDTKKVKELINIRGGLQANLAIGEATGDDREKIKKLSADITGLKNKIEASPPLLSALKAKILSLKAKFERQEKEKALKEQSEIETSLNTISVKLIPILKEALRLNKQLVEKWAVWNKLSEISGKTISDKKTSAGSVDMLNTVTNTLIQEWDGKSDGETRRFYSQGRYSDTRIIF